MSVGSLRATPERQIEDAKLLLDGARSLHHHCPTDYYAKDVEKYEAALNDLLDQYPLSTTERNN